MCRVAHRDILPHAHKKQRQCSFHRSYKAALLVLVCLLSWMVDSVGADEPESLQVEIPHHYADATGEDSIAIGWKALSTETWTTAIGRHAHATGFMATAVGSEAEAKAEDALAIGLSAEAMADSTIAIGSSSEATSYRAIAIGQSTEATAESAVAVGPESLAQAYGSLAIGVSAARAEKAIAIGFAHAVANNSIAIGYHAIAEAEAIAIGTSAQANLAPSAIAIGSSAEAEAEDTVAIGHNANARGSSAIVIGVSAEAYFENAVAIGHNAGGSRNAVAIGVSARANNQDAVAIGHDTSATAVASMAIGSLAQAWGNSAIAIGSHAESTKYNSVAIGRGAKATKINAMVLGGDGSSFDHPRLSVGINTRSPHTLASLDLSDKDRGFLINRMNTYERDKLNAELENSAEDGRGMLVYDTQKKKLYVWDQQWFDTGVTSTDEADLEFIHSVSLSGMNLTIEGGSADSLNTVQVDLSPLAEDEDADPANELIQSAFLTGTDLADLKLTIIEGTGNSATSVDADLSSFPINDADADPANELIQTAKLEGSTLTIEEGPTDSTNTIQVDLAAFNPTVMIQATAVDIGGKDHRSRKLENTGGKDPQQQMDGSIKGSRLGTTPTSQGQSRALKVKKSNKDEKGAVITYGNDKNTLGVVIPEAGHVTSMSAILESAVEEGGIQIFVKINGIEFKDEALTFNDGDGKRMANVKFSNPIPVEAGSLLEFGVELVFAGVKEVKPKKNVASLAAIVTFKQ